MNITTDEQHGLKSTSVHQMSKALESVKTRVINQLLKADDIGTVRFLQGQVDAVESLLKVFTL